MEIEFLGRKKKPVCDKVIVFSENGRKYEAKNPNGLYERQRAGENLFSTDYRF